MAWREQASLVEGFYCVRDLLEKTCPHWDLGTSYDGWVTALQREHHRLVPRIIKRLRQRMQAMPEYQNCGRWNAFAVDGSDAGCPRTTVNQDAMGDSGKPDGTPLSSMTTVRHLRLGLLWDFRVGPGTDSERGHLHQMLDELPHRSLLVADAGFIGYDMCREMLRRKQHFLLRVGGNVHLLQELGYERDDDPQTVYLWPGEHQKENLPPIKLRLIVITDENKQPVYLVTSVLDPEQMTDAEAAELYRQRWGIETFFRTLKQTMQHCMLGSRIPQRCYLELSWALLGVWLLELITVEQAVAAGHDPRTISPAQARNTVRRAMRDMRPCRRSRRTVAEVLAHCVQDGYQRRGPKATRDYPRKKTHKPPKPPKIKMPTEQQLARAKQLTPIFIAA